MNWFRRLMISELQKVYAECGLAQRKYKDLAFEIKAILASDESSCIDGNFVTQFGSCNRKQEVHLKLHPDPSNYHQSWT